MRILIVNQPMRNRGDESAHKAIIRSLLNAINDVKIKVLLYHRGINQYDIDSFAVQSERTVYKNPTFLTQGFTSIFKFALKHPVFKFLWYCHPRFLLSYRVFTKSDYVLCAPGGICMGGFQNWEHLVTLYQAKVLGKPIIYYGRSIGPFPEKTADNRLFKKVSIELLNYMQFISLRDAKSMQLANDLGINYCKTTDSAFLDYPNVDIPKAIRQQIGDSKYIVVVPNLLIWHYAYNGKMTREEVITFWSEIINKILDRYPKHKVVMLPQTYGDTTNPMDLNDIVFFEEIKEYNKDCRIVVIPDRYDSDVEQIVVRGSDLVVGARYHSIIFAINNNIPFISMSYEHKMSGILEILDKKECGIDLTGDNLLTREKRIAVIAEFVEKISDISPDDAPQKKAKLIAKECFAALMTHIK